MISGLSTILLWSAIIIMMFSIGGLVYAQQNENVTTSEPVFLAIQHAQSGTISEINSTSYSLQLNDLADNTILFSDRPNRIVVTQSTQEFIGNWTAGEDSFQVDPPNAALVVETDNTGQQETAIIELFNPIYNEGNNTLKYDFISVNATSIKLPNEFGQSTMIIDDKGDWTELGDMYIPYQKCKC